MKERRESRDHLVDKVRRYGTAVVAAAVLLPLQLVFVALAGIGIVYIVMRYTRPHAMGRAPASG